MQMPGAGSSASRDDLRFSLCEAFRGTWLGVHCTTHGRLAVDRGFPLPTVVRMEGGGKIHLGNCRIGAGVRFELETGGILTIGDGTTVGRNALIRTAQSVRIGKDCTIGWDVVIMDTNAHPLPGVEMNAPVVLGDRVVVGCRAIILKGVSVGDDAVIGAGSLIIKDVPPRAVVAGVPARVLRQG